MTTTARETMNFSEVNVTDIEALINDPSRCFEQKVDGTRALVVITTGDDGIPHFEFLGRRGQRLTHAAAALHFRKIEDALAPCFTRPGETVLDGEVMFDQGRFVIFDVPTMIVAGHTFSAPEMPYAKRREMLAVVGDCATSPVVVIARSETTPEAKRDLFNAVADGNGEGIMAKSLSAAYEPGKRVKHSVKVKFVKTADVVVTKVDRPDARHGNFEFAVNDASGSLVGIGACSAIGKPEVNVGDVIEVAYLNMGAGGRLVQPRMMKVRWSKSAAECDFAQFPVYSKAIIG